MLPTELSEDSNTPNLVIIGISLAAFGFLLVNAALVVWFFEYQRRKKAETTQQPGKTATIEMYAPSSYNDTVTGETLSSVSEKSESYSNEGSQPEYIDEARKKAASTYLVENGTDMPPPRYQKDGTLPTVYPNNMVNSRTLPHPRHNNNAGNIMDHRARDDQMLLTNGKGIYIPSPSPAPPPDGSYYNMNSDRYLSYPPMLQDYPSQLDFNAPQLAMAHLQPMSQASIISGTAVVSSGCAGGGGTLRRGIMRGTVVGVPQPDVTHHTTTNIGAIGVPILHDLHPVNIAVNTSTSGQTISNGGAILSAMPNVGATTAPKQPQSILKDPNRHKQQQQQQQLQQQQHHQQLLNANLVGIGMGMSPPPPGSLQILNIPTSMGGMAGISSNLLMTSSATFDPTNPHNMTSTFNTNGGGGTTIAFTDADGHLV